MVEMIDVIAAFVIVHVSYDSPNEMGSEDFKAE